MPTTNQLFLLWESDLEFNSTDKNNFIKENIDSDIFKGECIGIISKNQDNCGLEIIIDKDK